MGTRVAVVAGIYLACFSGLIHTAWRAQDRVSAGVLAAAMLALGARHFSQFRGRAGSAAWRSGMGSIALAFGAILVVLNLRLDVWLAAGRGVSLAEIHLLLPQWLIPVLTLVLLAWIGSLLALTRPQPSA
jgi:hypothetical protein